MSLPPLHFLRALESASRLGSFRAAADELHLTPSAISQQIRGVEAAIGARLFARTGRTVALTPQGRLFCDEVRRALRDLTDAALRARALGDKRLLRLCTVDVLAYEFLIPRLPQFQARFPEVELRIETSMRVVELHGSELDAALRVRGRAGPGLVSRPIGSAFSTPVCSPALARSVRRPEDLLTPTLIEMRAAGDNLWRNALALRGLKPERLALLSFESYFETLTAAERGLGVAFGLFPMTTDWIRQGRLAVPLPWRGEVPGGVYLVYRENDPRSALLDQVAAWLRERYAELESLPEGRVLAMPLKKEPAAEPLRRAGAARPGGRRQRARAQAHSGASLGSGGSFSETSHAEKPRAKTR